MKDDLEESEDLAWLTNRATSSKLGDVSEHDGRFRVKIGDRLLPAKYGRVVV
jgi:hypothetical protein